MNSHDKKFSLYFKTREKAVLARGKDYNYVTEFPQDLYIYNYKTKISSPLITYEWFPSQARYLLESYNKFIHYLLIDMKLVNFLVRLWLNLNFLFNYINATEN